MNKTVTLIFERADGSRTSAEARIGGSVMEAAVLGGIPTIEGECGGCLSCATCHVVAPEGLREVGDDEDAMLEGTVVARRPGSRLACQIPVTAELSGAVFCIPEEP